MQVTVIPAEELDRRSLASITFTFKTTLLCGCNKDQQAESSIPVDLPAQYTSSLSISQRLAALSRITDILHEQIDKDKQNVWLSYNTLHYITCTQKLTNGQLNLPPHGIKKRVMKKTKNTK